MREMLLAVATIFLLAAWTPFPTAVGPEVPLDAPAVTPVASTSPILATDGTGALLLSVEAFTPRIGIPGRFHWVGTLDEEAAPAGESQSLGFVLDASAASSGRGYLVTYYQSEQAQAIRYSANGTPLLPGIALGRSNRVSEVTWDGTAYIVVADNKAFSISEDGRILGTRAVASLPSGVGTASRNGVTVLVNHADDAPFTGAMYAHVIGGATHNLGSGISADVAAGDPGFLVVCVRGDSVFGRLLDPSGAPDGEAFEIASGTRPAVTWSGTEWLVTYESDLSLRAVRVLRGPVAPSFVIDAAGMNPAVAAKDGKVFVAWDQRSDPRFPTRTRLRSATIDGEILTIHEGSAGVVSTEQSQPLMATVDGATLVAWSDGGGTRIRRMDGRSAMQTITDAGRPVAFAAGEQDALLVTRGPGALVFTRVDRNGATLGTQRYPWNYIVDYAAAAWIGDRWVVVWRDSRDGISSRLVRVVVYADGTLDTPRHFSPMLSTSTLGLSVVAADSQALVLWSIGGNGSGRTMTFTIDRDGVAREGRDLGHLMFNAASSGEDVLAASVAGANLQWEHVLPDGKGAKGKMTLPAGIMTLQTFFTGENYLLLVARLASSPNRIELYGVRVDLTGTAIDDEPVLFARVFTALQPAFAGAVLRNGTTIDLAYYRALDEAAQFYQFPRLVFRSVHDAPRRRVVR